MSTGEQLYLGLVIAAPTAFALALGYQSLAEWLSQRRKNA